MPAASRIPVQLIIGATGAGKSTLVSRILAQRPPEEHWAVLVNDFGKVTIAGADAVTVREVSGCICCTAHVMLRTALVTLLRDVRPQRLLIEASAAAHPAALMKLLAERGLREALELATTICVVSAGQLADSRYANSDVYREQIAAADSIAITGEEKALAEARSAIARMTSTPARGFEERPDRFGPPPE